MTRCLILQRLCLCLGFSHDGEASPIRFPSIFGNIPEFIVDPWVTDMLDDQAWDDDTISTIISGRQQNPFKLKEANESLDVDWDSTSEVLNQAEALRIMLETW